VFYLLTVVLAWGLVWPVNKVLLESLPPLWLMAVRRPSPPSPCSRSPARAAWRRRRGRTLVVLSIALLHDRLWRLPPGLQTVPTGRRSAGLHDAAGAPAPRCPGERLSARRLVGVVIDWAVCCPFNPLPD
jgi:hypothetical protein